MISPLRHCEGWWSSSVLGVSRPSPKQSVARHKCRTTFVILNPNSRAFSNLGHRFILWPETRFRFDGFDSARGEENAGFGMSRQKVKFEAFTSGERARRADIKHYNSGD